MNSRRYLMCVLPALALCLAAIGCSGARDDLPREAIEGTVTMDGQSLPGGVIQFYPTGEAAKAGVVASNAEIKDGKFSIPREDGLVPGTYKVAISHQEVKEVEAKGKKNLAAGRKQLGPELIPAKYNKNSDLKQDIKSGGGKGLTFELKSK
jgi:hypothetical protein